MKRFMLFLAGMLLLTGCGGKNLHNCHASYGHSVHALAQKQGLACPPKNPRLRPKALTAVPSVLQFDSVDVNTVPRWAHYAAGYVDGSWPTYFRMKQLFPVVVGISVSSGAGADCIDLEPGNPPPSAARPWVLWQFSQGNPQPCVYSMLSWMGQIRANLSGLAQCSTASQTHCYRLWDADWTYSYHVDGGFNCTQYTDAYGGANLDASACETSFYPAPAPPKPKPVEHCLRRPYPQSVGCGKVRYGYNVTLRDIAKLNSRLKQHHCSARAHPSYCRGWRVSLGRDEANIVAFRRLYA